MEQQNPIEIVNRILADAVVRSASEICLEPRLRDVAVHYTVKGVATEVSSLPRPIEKLVFNRFVTMAGKDYWRPGPARHGTIEVAFYGKPCRFALVFEPGMLSEDLVLRRLPG